MNKKALQIQTNYLEDDEERSPIFTTSKISFEQKLEAATVFEKTLSIILAKNFISCWKELKAHQLFTKDFNQHNRFNSNSHNHEPKNLTFQARIQSLENKTRSQSQRGLMKQQFGSQSQEEFRRAHRSVRVISQEIENSRATVLKQIVEKLKNARKINHTSHEVQKSKNDEVLKKINQLEKMVRTLTSSNHRQKQDTGKIKIQKESKDEEDILKVELKKSEGEKITSNEDYVIKSFMKEIQKIRSEIHEIKLNNEAILKSSLDRSRASSYSGQNLSKFGDIKQTISEAVKHPQIPTQDQPLEILQTDGVTNFIQTPGHALSMISKKEINKSQLLQQVKSTPIHGYSGTNLQASTNQLHYNGAIKDADPMTSTISKSMAQTHYQNFSHSNQAFSNYTQVKPISNPIIVSQAQNEAPYWRPFPSNPQYPNYPQNQVVQPQEGQYFQTSQPSQIKFILQPQAQHTVARPPVGFIQPNRSIQVERVEGGSEFPRFDHIKTNTTLYSKNNVYSDASSTSTLGGVTFNWQGGHYRNPSIQYHEGLGNGNGHISLTNHCSACGRNCGCPRTYSSRPKFI